MDAGRETMILRHMWICIQGDGRRRELINPGLWSCGGERKSLIYYRLPQYILLIIAFPLQVEVKPSWTHHPPPHSNQQLAIVRWEDIQCQITWHYILEVAPSRTKLSRFQSCFAGWHQGRDQMANTDTIRRRRDNSNCTCIGQDSRPIAPARTIELCQEFCLWKVWAGYRIIYNRICLHHCLATTSSAVEVTN